MLHAPPISFSTWSPERYFIFKIQIPCICLISLVKVLLRIRTRTRYSTLGFAWRQYHFFQLWYNKTEGSFRKVWRLSRN
jgi:hypothetical protein